MADLTASLEEKKKRKSTALLAVMDENCSSSAGSLMYEFDEGAERSKYFYECKAFDAAKGVYLTNAVEKRHLEEKQLELYEIDP